MLGAGYTIAQILDPPPSPAAMFPEGAIVYAEAKDLESLLQWWNNSSVKKDWEASANYEVFQNSRLYLKLKSRINKWGAGGNFTFSIDNLAQVAGTKTGLALYDIGELKAVAATHLPFSKAKTTELWLAKGRFQEKRSGELTYYIEPRDGSLAFAYKEPYLMISTDEGLLVRSLSGSSALNQSTKWQHFQKVPESDVSLFLDQEALQKNRYFRKYWIHRNVPDFDSIQAVWIDLSVEQNAIVERRYYHRSNSAHQATANHQELIRHFKQFRHDALYFDAPVASDTATHHIFRMLNRLPEREQKGSYPPSFSGAAERATQAETRNILLEQIDEPVLKVKAETLLQATQEEQIKKLIDAAQPGAQIRFSYPLWDHQALFVRFPQSFILQLTNFSQFDQQQFLDLLLTHFLLLHSTQDQGGRWHSEGNGIFVLQSFRPLYVKFQNPWIVLSTEESDFRQVAANLPDPELISNGNYREVNWKDGRWKYSRLMRRLDHGGYQEDAPLLFSENIASLLTVLDPIVSSSVVQTENQEVVRYELK
jgi:hypothetical protein